MENDMRLMCMMEEEILFLLEKKRENKLKNELAKEKVKILMFGFMMSTIELEKNELFKPFN